MTTRLTFSFAFLFVLGPLAAQDAGLRGGVHEPPLVTRLLAPDAHTAERFITVEAVASVRVPPTRMRLVFSVSAIGADGATAGTAMRALVASTRERLVAAGVAASDIDVDFIAALPTYDWRAEQQDKTAVLAERRTGMRVQSNLHVAVADEAAARTAIETATAGEGVDLLAVDYWSDELAAKRAEALQQALAAARAKATTLFAVFAEPPRPVNVHEQMRVLFPQQLYHTLPAVEDGAARWYARDELPRVPARRPLLIYYRGLFADVDAGATTMPGKRDIEVVSTVRLYFEAPHRRAN
jgi:uncharacterized protein YggE